ncbi:hypothetical protein ABH924_003299 [Arthrobacter sp. GAS37]|uniref:hypothetical protein n=1 Tax=Arthrobacter sp. GAS37 TaxID=3156261 RepID=UPI003836818D
MKKILLAVFALALGIATAILFTQCGTTAPRDASAPESQVAEQPQSPGFPAPTASPPVGTPSPAITLPADAKLTAPAQPPMGSENNPKPLEWTPQARKEALGIATEVIKDLADPQSQQSNQAMMTAIGNKLTDHAKALWSKADPTHLSLKNIVGPATLEPGWETNPYWAWASIPTNDGQWRLNLHRSTESGDWKVDSLQPPSPG